MNNDSHYPSKSHSAATALAEGRRFVWCGIGDVPHGWKTLPFAAPGDGNEHD